MTTIKSYTDIEQSRKLAEILPLESADMCYIAHSELINIHEPFYKKKDKEDIPCWSLAALIDILPDELKDDDGYIYRNLAYHLKGKYTVHYPRLTTLWPSLYSEKADNLVDACYKLIVKLHNDNIL
jgi:hypothetical protein